MKSAEEWAGIVAIAMAQAQMLDEESLAPTMEKAIRAIQADALEATAAFCSTHETWGPGDMHDPMSEGIRALKPEGT